jgi:hypothetical protein
VADPEACETASSGGEIGRRCSEERLFFWDLGEGVSGTEMSSSSWMGSGAFGVSFVAGVFLLDFVGVSETLGLEAALEPEPLRSLAGEPVFDPTLGGAFPTADILFDRLEKESLKLQSRVAILGIHGQQ